MERYPFVNTDSASSLILDTEQTIDNISKLYEQLLRSDTALETVVKELQLNPNPVTLQSVCDILFKIIPMRDSFNQLHPLLTTQEQMNKYMCGDNVGIGDCKLISIIAAYIFIELCQLPTVLSIRIYSGHPILYVNIDDIPYKVSFLHEKPYVKAFEADDPFIVSSEQSTSISFTDEDIEHGNTILYWKVRDAMYVLDCMNVLRRAVVNYVIDPVYYDLVFQSTIDLLQGSGIFSKPVISYWTSEMERVKDLYRYKLYSREGIKDVIKLKQLIASTLRLK